MGVRRSAGVAPVDGEEWRVGAMQRIDYRAPCWVGGWRTDPETVPTMSVPGARGSRDTIINLQTKSDALMQVLTSDTGSPNWTHAWG